MTPEQWALAERLYHEAASIAIADRHSWLARVCGDEPVRREVESLLAQDASRTGVLDGHALEQVTPEAARENLAGRQLGGYAFLSLIDEGGMGQVYRARDLTLPRDVAVKVVSPEFTHDAVRRARFRKEAEILASFAHPHIAHIYAFVETEGRFLLAMELVPGETLAACLSRGPMRISEALDVAAQIAEALDAAHEQGIIHRDLKPANIRITPDGVVKVLDFGLATSTRPALADERAAITRTAPGMLLGTVAYMSPEQARGETVDKRTDIWAFGCVLFEMLTGHKTFGGPTATDTIAAILDRDPDWSLLPPAVPPTIVTLLRRCLDKDRKRRLRDIGEARIALEAPSSSEPPTIRWRPWPRYIAMVTLMAVAIASFALIYSRFARPADPQLVELEILPPPGVKWGLLPPEPVARVAPDGNRIVFAGEPRADEGTNTIGLWVRDVGDKNASYLAGSNDYLGNTQAPFWSPDSQTIAYCTRSGKTIKKIAADGRSAGQIEVLCNGDGSWNTRGEMLFKAPGGLFLVGENGGEAKQITTDDGAAEDHRHPRFLPDGVRFLFTRRSSSTAKAGVYLGRTDDKRTTRIFPDASMAEYVEAPDGARYIFFVRVADLIAQRVDGDTLAPVALPVRVARRMSMGNSRLPSFSVAPTLLVYRNNVGDSTFVWTDRKGQATGVRYGGTTAMGTPALSHDERTLAFSRLNPDTNLFELWKLDIARGTPQKLYDAPTIVAGPAFSPDDRQLAFTANQSTFIMRLESGEVSEVDCGGPCRGDLVTDWSAVDNRLIRSAGDVTWLTPGHPMPPKMFTKGFHPKLSPDGRWLAYTSSETETPEVYVQRFPDGTRKKVVSVDGGFQPYWRGDGGELFYRNDAGDIMAAQLRLGDEVQVVRTDRLFRERLGDGGNDFSRRDFIVNRDGQRFILNVRTRETPPVTVVRNWAQRLGK